MIITNMRSSSVSTFKSCPMEWFFQYNLGWDGGSNKAMVKGTIVHAVLELLACIKQAEQNGKKSISTDMGISRLKVVDYLKTEKNLDKLTGRLYDIHVEKYSQLNWLDADKKDCVKWVRKTLVDWSGKFDPRIRDIIEPELFFDIEIVRPWSAYKYELPSGEILQGFLNVRGTVDLITSVDDHIEVIDWKTGKFWDWSTSKPKTAEGLKDDMQVRMYHYVLSQLYPDKQIIITMVYLNNAGPISVYLDDADIIKTETLIKNYFQTIRDSTPTCNKSWKCTKFCEFGKNTFEGTKITPLKSGRLMTMCEQLQYVLQHRDERQVLTNMVNGDICENLGKYNQG
jgi:hypothetical protein